jgi:hypothetical protein|tara:strand:- start:318 stop:719 length:402 start_codon:yes stop_codon:yes gene_type:complete
MTVKLLLLKSGEEVISDINEMAVGEEDDQKVVGYFLNKPCIVQKQNPGVIEQDKRQTKAGFEVSLIPWIALSADDIIPIPADWLVTMVEPVDQLREMYVGDVLNYASNNNATEDGTSDQDDTADEQPDSSESN